ncbi:myocardin-related transcription factor B-like isoform X2 [Myxocyprinus asiaticus]|uniref:myocardin-related transcription factor B-like isoform X2 n=1 Tax=Myxocyprinus asiaticus TaxID=70543 RepID=UPI0022222427|nr:myocardin-related transcription factor B-like isoform X2 [Myxocyprinus asiaticus]
MGLQTRPLSHPSLSSMACLEVETLNVCREIEGELWSQLESYRVSQGSPKNIRVDISSTNIGMTAGMSCTSGPDKKINYVLQLRLQQRRTRKQLADQGIMPPLKTPAAFHEQVKSLERARTENFLKHKIRSRPERAELVRMHILQETLAEPSLQATQMKLKRARLADDLNEKIAQRPGPLELVEKNILPVDSSVKEAIIVGEVNYPRTLDIYNFEEDSSDALSPEQPASQESQGSASSPIEARLPDASSVSPPTGSNLQFCPPTTQCTDFLSGTSVGDQANSRVMTAIQPVTAATPTKPGPTLVKHSQPKQPSDKSRSRKSKEPKPRVKKLKYHQYIPPDQKQETNEAPMDSSYARLLQQQQQFLQLQILSQQQQHYNYQAILPAPLKSVAESQNSCPNVTLSNSPTSVVVSLPSAAPSHPNNTLTSRKPGPLPASLDEMKVAELKMELKLRGLPVSGTKTDLIERLRANQESLQPASAMDTNISKYSLQPDSMSTTPPLSPEQLEVSSVSMEESRNSPTKSPARPPTITSPIRPTPENMVMETKVSEKDQRLHEKERQIEELMRKLEQEQRLVEELKMQLEVEKRSQQGGGQQPEPISLIQIKEENSAAPSCSSENSPLPQTTGVKREEPHAQMHHTQVQQFYINTQHVPQTQALINTHSATQILLPISLPANISLPSNPITTQAHNILQGTVPRLAQNLIQTALLQTQTSDNTMLQQHSNQTQSANQPLPLCGSSSPGFEYRQNQNHPMAEMPQCFLNNSPRVSPRHTPNGPINKPPSPCQHNYIPQPSTFPNHHSPKGKDPPRYEEAVKQTRSLQATMQVPTTTSQHMDDLFDVLIESGEISPLTRHDPLLEKLLPVTANITTLPINTVLSRPPPQIHMAHMPNQLQAPPLSLVALATDNQLEALLEDTEPRTLRLMEELKNQLLEPHSPMDTSDLTFTDRPTSTLNLQEATMDNMEWLDLTMPGAAGISSPAAVFSSDFLDSPDLQLHWE